MGWLAGLCARGRRHQPVHTEGEEPDYRFRLANERTFLAWIRTALALLAGGIAVVQFVPSFGIDWDGRVLGVSLVLLVVLIAASSYTRWERRERAIRLGEPLPASPLSRLVDLGITVVILLALAFVLTDVATGHA